MKIILFHNLETQLVSTEAKGPTATLQSFRLLVCCCQGAVTSQYLGKIALELPEFHELLEFKHAWSLEFPQGKP